MIIKDLTDDQLRSLRADLDCNLTVSAVLDKSTVRALVEEVARARLLDRKALNALDDDRRQFVVEQTERICALEDALRPFAMDDGAHEEYIEGGAGLCVECDTNNRSDPDEAAWPCKYELARRALARWEAVENG